MYKIPLSEIKAKLLSSGKINSALLEKRIKDKINDLSGLISEEGAACIIANELGVELFTAAASAKLKIKEAYPGMRNISVLGKVVRKFEMREFSKGDRTGKVCSLMIGDETGTARLVFWNDQVSLAEKVKEEDLVLVKDAYVKENNNGKEIHLGSTSTIDINPPGETVGEVRKTSTYSRKQIESLKGDESGIELLGTVVQIFDPRFFYLCPTCNKKATESDGQYVCNEHGSVRPELSYVLNLIVDDGTGNIRTVFWKNQVQHLLGKNDSDMDLFRRDIAKFEDVKTDLLGEQYKLLGRVAKNDVFDRLEFNVQIVEKANPAEELARLENKK
jgi:replication factor A1